MSSGLPSSPLGPVIESPCVRVCEIDRSLGVCTGCKRTLSEIGNWSRMSATERRAVMQDLASR